MEAEKRDNPPFKKAKTPRPYSPKLLAEWNKGVQAGMHALHDNGRTWVEVGKVLGIGISETKRIRSGERNAPLPAFIHLAEALNISLVELLMMGQEEE